MIELADQHFLVRDRVLPLGDVLDGEQDQVFPTAITDELSGIEQNAPPARPRGPVRELDVLELVIFRQDLFDHVPQVRNIPLPAAKLVQRPPDDLARCQVEQLVERPVGRLHPYLGIQDHQGLAARLDDRLCIHARLVDRLARASSLGDVYEGDDEAGDPVVPCAVGQYPANEPLSLVAADLRLDRRQPLQHHVRIAEQPVVDELAREVTDRPTDIGGDKFQKLPRGRREPLDPEFGIQKHRRDLGAGQQVRQVVAGLVQLADLVLELTIDRMQLLVERLKLLLRGLQFLVGRLKLLVHRGRFFVRGLHLLVDALQLLDRALQFGAGRSQLALESG